MDENQTMDHDRITINDGGRFQSYLEPAFFVPLPESSHFSSTLL